MAGDMGRLAREPAFDPHAFGSSRLESPGQDRPLAGTEDLPPMPMLPTLTGTICSEKLPMSKPSSAKNDSWGDDRVSRLQAGSASLVGLLP